MNTIASTSSSKFLYGFLVNVFSTSLLVRVLLSHMLNARFAWPDVFFWMGVAASLIIFTRKCLHGSPLSVARRLLPLLTLLAIASVLLPFFTPRPGWHGLVNAVVLLGVTAPQLLLIIRAEQRLIALHRAFLETEARLAESEQRWHQLVAHSPFPIVVHQDGHIVLINKAGQQELGLHDWQEMIGKPFADMLDPFSAANMAALLSKADAASAPLQLEHRYVRSDGTAAPFLSLSLPLLLEGKRAFLTMGKEMPPAKPMEQAPNYRRFTEFLPEAHVVHEGGDITYINRAGLELFGIKSPHDVLGAPFSSLFHPGDRPRIEQYLAHSESGKVHRLSDLTLLRPDGAVRQVEIVSLFMNDQGLSAPFTMIRDITMQKEADAHIHFMAFHDALTGLPNRRMFEHQLSLLIENGAINKAAVLYIDLDRFKWVNDTFGHEMGDVLLKQAAARIQARAGADDLAARQGGDEFVLLLGSIAHLDGVTGTAAALLADLSAPFFLGGHEVQISCSIGIALYPDDGATKDELMKNADAALYRVKQSGRNGYSFFVSGL